MSAVEYETVNIPKTTKVCPLCETYAQRQASKPVVVMSCEGGCLRGEVARRAANMLCFEMAPEKLPACVLAEPSLRTLGSARWRGTQADS
jgi:hypothetical protein